MQTKSLRWIAYPTTRIIWNLHPAAAGREETIHAINRLRKAGCDLSAACAERGISRATYYRWQQRYRDCGARGLTPRSRQPKRCRTARWSTQDERLVWQLRRAHPTYGKLRLWRVLVRDHGFTASASTVGRILARGRRLGRIKPCAFYAQGQVKPKRRRQFSGHAKRWRYGQRAKKPGELVQIDHLSVSLLPGHVIKDFKAICPVSKCLVQRAYGRATAGNAGRFLQEVVEQLPFPIRGIQVDGGSEFMAGFEGACQDLQIELYVLPPRRPQYNGCVERVNRTVREEFYSQYQGEVDLASVNQGLAEYQHQYNHFRPHRVLALSTPMEYLECLGMAV